MGKIMKGDYSSSTKTDFCSSKKWFVWNFIYRTKNNCEYWGSKTEKFSNENLDWKYKTILTIIEIKSDFLSNKSVWRIV